MKSNITIDCRSVIGHRSKKEIIQKVEEFTGFSYFQEYNEWDEESYPYITVAIYLVTNTNWAGVINHMMKK